MEVVVVGAVVVVVEGGANPKENVGLVVVSTGLLASVVVVVVGGAKLKENDGFGGSLVVVVGADGAVVEVEPKSIDGWVVVGADGTDGAAAGVVDHPNNEN